MKKQFVIIGIVAILVCVGLSGCIQNLNASDDNNWQTVQTISGSIHNGTWFFAKEITPINLEKQEQFFSLVMYISFVNYSGNLSLKGYTENNQIKEMEIHPEIYGGQNGTYSIEITIPVKGNISDYPYDKYRGNITFDITDDYKIIDLNGINNDSSLSQWQLNISGENSTLFFTFSRNAEVNTYRLLAWFGLITLFINAFSFAFSLGNRKSFLDSFFNHLGNVTLIPLTIGIIFNYIIFNIPEPFNCYADILWLFLIGSIVFGAIAFAYREKVDR